MVCNACNLDCDIWLCAGMGVSCLQQLFVAFAGTKSLSIVAVACGSLANISFPAISSIKSKSVPRHEQVSAILCLCVLPWQNPQCILIWCQEAIASMLDHVTLLCIKLRALERAHEVGSFRAPKCMHWGRICSLPHEGGACLECRIDKASRLSLRTPSCSMHS